MKGLLKLFITGAIIAPLTISVFSCSEDPDCSLNARAMMQCNIFQTNEESGATEELSLTEVTITALGTDSVIINRASNVKALSLPLRFAEDSTVLIFNYQLEPKDTLLVRHTNTPYFLSMDCGYQMKQVITSIEYTRNQLDSISITNKEAGIYGTENLKLFY